MLHLLLSKENKQSKTQHIICISMLLKSYSQAVLINFRNFIWNIDPACQLHVCGKWHVATTNPFQSS
jgi:hypothetical protein